MNHPETDWGEQVARSIFGFALHAILGSLGSFALGLLVNAGLCAIVKPANNDSLLFVSLIISSALIVFLLRFRAGDWVSRRWFSLTAPWVGLLGLAALGFGAQDLMREWSPTWSHETRYAYVLSQLFCVGSGCSATEGLSAALFGWPFVSWTSYSFASCVALWISRKHHRAAEPAHVPMP
jgi:hypothetical protein